MDLVQYTLLTTTLVGSNQLIRLARAKDYWGVVTILTAVVVGAAFGATHYMGLDITKGILAGFGSVGIMTGIAHFGKGNSITPNSDPVVKQ